jgi:hypothetical protein
MSSFLGIRNVVAKEFDLNEIGNKTCDKYFLTAMYFSQLVYFRWEFVEKSLTTLPGYVSHTIFDVGSTQAFFVEFEKTCWVSFRGTETEFNDWRIILAFLQIRYKQTEIHRGFNRALSNVKGKILKKIVEARIQGKKIHYTGHSMGGALATLMVLEHKPDTATVFGSPRIMKGTTLAYRYNNFPFFRIENDWDIITRIPPSFLGLLKYKHVGKCIKYKHRFAFIKSHFIKNYLTSALDVYYAKSTGLDIDCYDPKKLKKRKKPLDKK